MVTCGAGTAVFPRSGTVRGALRRVRVRGAELNRRMPERAKVRPDDVAGFGEAWPGPERLWSTGSPGRDLASLPG